MPSRTALAPLLLTFLVGACGSAGSSDSENGAASGGSPADGGSSGSSTAGTQGGTTAAAGTSATAGMSGPGSGGASAASGGSKAAGGASGGVAGKSAMDSGSGGLEAGGMTGGAGMGGLMTGCGGESGCSGAFGGGGRGAGGRGAGGRGSGGRGMGGQAGLATAGGGMGTAGAGACPRNGHVSYTLMKNANPTADEQKAYDLITAAMDEAVDYYNCYTNITKADTVSYVPSVDTADGNINGNIRFGHEEYMEYITAMHEIAHTVGVGTAPAWQGLVVNGIFTGEHATLELRTITGNPTDQLNADTQHFWPYGLNYTSEVKSEADVIDHCLMVSAIRLDLGFDP